MSTKIQAETSSLRSTSFFLKEKAVPQQEIERVISDRFKDEEGKPVPFVLRAVSPARARELERLAQKPVKNGNGKTIGTEPDFDKIGDLMIIESCEFPDFSDAELIKSYGVRNAEQLLNTMLAIGEKLKLSNAVNEVNLINQEPMSDLVDDAKD